MVSSVQAAFDPIVYLSIGWHVYTQNLVSTCTPLSGQHHTNLLNAFRFPLCGDEANRQSGPSWM